MKTYKKSLSQFVLLSLEKTVDGYCRFEDFANHHYRYRYGAPELKKSALAAAIKRLREGGLVNIDVDSGAIIVKLTKYGKDALQGIVAEDDKWDGYWRIVIYDIPEKHFLLRNILRRKLKEWGFKKWQQSVWVTKNNVTLKLRFLIKKLEIDQWVSVIESNDKVLSNIL